MSLSCNTPPPAPPGAYWYLISISNKSWSCTPQGGRGREGPRGGYSNSPVPGGVQGASPRVQGPGHRGTPDPLLARPRPPPGGTATLLPLPPGAYPGSIGGGAGRAPGRTRPYGLPMGPGMGSVGRPGPGPPGTTHQEGGYWIACIPAGGQLPASRPLPAPMVPWGLPPGGGHGSVSPLGSPPGGSTTGGGAHSLWIPYLPPVPVL